MAHSKIRCEVRKHHISGKKVKKNAIFFVFQVKKWLILRIVFAASNHVYSRPGGHRCQSMSTFHRETALGEHLRVGAKSRKMAKIRTFGMQSAVTFSRMCFVKFLFNMGILGLWEHRCQSLGNFYNGVKKLSHSEFTIFLYRFLDFRTLIFTPSIFNPSNHPQNPTQPYEWVSMHKPGDGH